LNTDNTNWKATAQLFSGRKNPEWKLKSAQQKSWMQLWEQAGLSDTEVEHIYTLGYTGCRLQFDEHSHWFLYNGCVSFYENGKIVSKKDEGRKMELFLLGTADDEVKEILQQQHII
jgi:hypothetical protein